MNNTYAHELMMLERERHMERMLKQRSMVAAAKQGQPHRSMGLIGWLRTLLMPNSRGSLPSADSAQAI
jgi:hypothetical protein